MKAYETVFSHRKFEVLRAGRDRYYLKLKGGIRYASPGLKRITEEEAREVIRAHARKEVDRGREPLEETDGQVLPDHYYSDKGAGEGPGAFPLWRPERRWRGR